jgi:hypothetical protein
VTSEERHELEALVRRSQVLAARARQALDDLDATITETVDLLSRDQEGQGNA